MAKQNREKVNTGGHAAGSESLFADLGLSFRPDVTDRSALVRHFKVELVLALALAFGAAFITLEGEAWWLDGLIWLGAGLCLLPLVAYLGRSRGSFLSPGDRE
jgi:hypothetical protein